MGLIKDGDDFAVLSDIAGQEDHYGDMDFKVAGTTSGITALQMDIKIAGVTREIMDVALQQAREGRLHIIELMSQTMETPRPELSKFAPRLHTLYIPVAKIRDIIGPGGKTIRSITEETGCEVEVENDGKVTIASPDGVAAARAIEIIEQISDPFERSLEKIANTHKIASALVFRVGRHMKNDALNQITSAFIPMRISLRSGNHKSISNETSIDNQRRAIRI